MDIATIHTLYQYHYGRWQEVWDSILTLTDVQFTEAVPYSLGSLRNHMVHIADDDLSWITLIETGTKPDPQLDPQAFTTRDAVYTQHQSAQTHILDFVQNLTETQLKEQFTWQPAAVEHPQSLTTSQILLHVVNHGTDHRAQVLRILHDLGAPTFDQDLMDYWVQTGTTQSS